MILLFASKVVVYVTSAIFIHPIFHSTIFSSFQMERKAGIWTFHCRWSTTAIPIALKRSRSFSDMLIGCMCVHPRLSHPTSSRVVDYSSSWSVMPGLPLINAISHGLPTTRQRLGLISIKDYRAARHGSGWTCSPSLHSQGWALVYAAAPSGLSGYLL